MTEFGLYSINQNGIDFLVDNETDIAKGNSTKLSERPFYLGLVDKENNNFVYLIPLTTIDSEQKRQRINDYINKRSNDIRSSFYVTTTIEGREQAFKISSVLILESSMIRPWTLRNSHYVVENQALKNEISRKLRILINYYVRNPHKSENKIIDCKKKLLELQVNH